MSMLCDGSPITTAGWGVPLVQAKRSIEIEKLLHWAYRDELSKRTTSSAEGIWDQIAEYGQRGGIDPGHGAAQRYPHFGLPHPDAEEIEKAVARLENLILDWSASCDAIMGDMAPLIQKRDVLMVRSLRTAALVTMHANMGSRPDWREDPPRPYFIQAERGRNRAKIIGQCLSKDRYTVGAYCPLQWEPSPLNIAVARAEYACWHRGLTMLAQTLDLDSHTALPPAAPGRPWAGERDPVHRVYAVGERPQREQRLPLKPERARALGPMRRKKPDEPEKQSA